MLVREFAARRGVHVPMWTWCRAKRTDDQLRIVLSNCRLHRCGRSYDGDRHLMPQLAQRNPGPLTQPVVRRDQEQIRTDLFPFDVTSAAIEVRRERIGAPMSVRSSIVSSPVNSFNMAGEATRREGAVHLPSGLSRRR